jgi:hypothetical protein
MGGMKNALMDIHQCGLCASAGWISFDSGDGTPDYEPCACNPYEFPKDELVGIFEDWERAWGDEPTDE